MRSSKDLAKRLRFDRFPRPDRFRRWYRWLGVAAVIIALAVWMLFSRAVGERQYLPGPVSPAHATFGDRCERCHAPFKSMPDDACLTCHDAQLHSEFEASSPRCAACHIEHRGGHELSDVRNVTCLACHEQLSTKRSPPIIESDIRSLAAHPVFGPLREGRTDQAAVRFNHRLHLTSDKIASTDKLTCADCHQPSETGTLMQPIRFGPHCERCHKQEVQGPVGSIAAVHRTPEVVRADLLAQLAVIGIRDAESIFAPPARPLPGVRAAPIDDSRTLRDYQQRWLEKIEKTLYQPLHEPETTAGTPPQGLLEANKYCFLCHIQGDDPEGDNPAAAEIAAIKQTHIPSHWLQRAEFSHGRHELMACQACHESAETSALTSDINLPPKERCAQCHVDGAIQSAGTACISCHRYHHTSQSIARPAHQRTPLSLDLLTGKEPPGPPSE